MNVQEISKHVSLQQNYPPKMGGAIYHPCWFYKSAIRIILGVGKCSACEKASLLEQTDREFHAEPGIHGVCHFGGEAQACVSTWQRISTCISFL